MFYQMVVQLFYCGWNGFGQVPSNPDSLITRLTPFPAKESVTSVSCGWSALCIVSGSNLFVSGFLDGEANSSKELSLEKNESFEQVANNSNYIVALSQSKKLWRRTSTSRQSNSQFKLFSLGESFSDESKDYVDRVSCSDNIYMALTRLGNLFAIPSKISDPSLAVTDMACGNEHTVFITATGSVYAYGQGSRGQLGHGDLDAEEEPREVDALGGVRMQYVSCGGWHTAVVSQDGDLYTWGWNRFGQLGLNGNTAGTSERVEQERSPDMRLSAQQIPSKSEKPPGTHTSSKDLDHDDDGIGGVYALPQLVDWTEKRIVSLSCGLRHTVVALEDGSLWGCGWNAYGQLGMSPVLNPQRAAMTRISTPPEVAGTIRSVVCGGWSTCVLVSR